MDGSEIGFVRDSRSEFRAKPTGDGLCRWPKARTAAFAASYEAAEPIGGAAWADPLPLPDVLPSVPAFPPELLPDDLRAWSSDISERMNCPPDFVAVPAMIGAGSLIGRRVVIRPEQHTDWAEPANLWGCIVGPPGAMKSPAVREALAPLSRLEANAATANEAAAANHKAAEDFHKLTKEAALSNAKAALRKRDGVNPEALARAELANIAEPEPPAERRFLTNDGTAEKLGEICAANPNGVLVHRDELLTMFADLDREEKASARGFFLSGWGGLEAYTFDRIARGTVRIPAVCLSVLGTTQPNHFAKYRGLIPRLALVSHLASGGTGPVGERAVVRALGWGEYLTAHAKRAYASLATESADTARAIWRRVQKGDLTDGFAARDLYRKQWSGLADRKRVEQGLELLVDCGWLSAVPVETGGRPTESYRINPKAGR